MIDPQGQALKWIKNMEKERVGYKTSQLIEHWLSVIISSLPQNLNIIDLQQPNFLQVLEACIQSGTPVLLQNIQEKLDPSLAPLMNKALVQKGM